MTPPLPQSPVSAAHPAAMTTVNTKGMDERNFRPKTLASFIGQEQMKITLSMMTRSATKRQRTIEHLAFFGGPGLGKTTLASVVANEMGSRMHELAAPSVSKPGDLAGVLTQLMPGDVLFLDECHALSRDVAETLYSAMEDFKINIMLNDKKPPLRMTLHPFTLIGSTTDFGRLPAPMRARFGQTFHLQPYTIEQLKQIIERAAEKLDFFTEAASLEAIALRSRNTPRIALRLLRRCVDAAVDQDEDFIDADLVEATMPLLGLDVMGLEEADRMYMATLIEVYGGGPAGVRAISVSANLDTATAEQVVEPILLTMGLIARTPRGRRITRKGYQHYQSFVLKPAPVKWGKVEAAD